jgi:hypothetical protein
MRRYQGLEVNDYVFTLDALPLKPSRFCNIGVNQSAQSASGGILGLRRGFKTTLTIS